MQRHPSTEQKKRERLWGQVSIESNPSKGSGWGRSSRSNSGATGGAVGGFTGGDARAVTLGDAITCESSEISSSMSDYLEYPRESDRSSQSDSYVSSEQFEYDHHFQDGIDSESASERAETLATSSPSESRKNLFATDDGGAPGRARVAVRLRPYLPSESTDHVPAVEMTSDGNGIVLSKSYVGHKEFYYDSVFGDMSTQREVFEAMALPIVEDVLNGYNGTILAYGQTGTGKTYTLANEQGRQDPNNGVVSQSLEKIFACADAEFDHTEYCVYLSYVQIYMEMIQDLLAPEQWNLSIREGTDDGVFVAGCSQVAVADVDECLQYIQQGNTNRVVAFTKMNSHSSRSHSVLTLTVTRRQKMTSSDYANPSSVQQMAGRHVLRGKLQIVDLAGSERVKKTGSSGLRLDEVKAINSSLSALGNVIHSLTDPKSAHVPYRDSKLTRLLQDSLGGNAKTGLIVTIGPSAAHSNETTSSLLFAQRAMQVQCRARQNVEVDYKALSSQLQAYLDEQEWHIKDSRSLINSQREELLRLQAALSMVTDNRYVEAGKLKADYDRELAQSQQAYEEEVKSVQADYQTMLAMLEAELKEEREAHAATQRQLEDAQSELKKIKRRAHQGTKQLREEVASLREEREQVVADLEGFDETFVEMLSRYEQHASEVTLTEAADEWMSTERSQVFPEFSRLSTAFEMSPPMSPSGSPRHRNTRAHANNPFVAGGLRPFRGLLDRLLGSNNFSRVMFSALPSVIDKVSRRRPPSSLGGPQQQPHTSYDDDDMGAVLRGNWFELVRGMLDRVLETELAGHDAVLCTPRVPETNSNAASLTGKDWAQLRRAMSKVLRESGEPPHSSFQFLSRRRGRLSEMDWADVQSLFELPSAQIGDFDDDDEEEEEDETAVPSQHQPSQRQQQQQHQTQSLSTQAARPKKAGIVWEVKRSRDSKPSPAATATSTGGSGSHRTGFSLPLGSGAASQPPSSVNAPSLSHSAVLGQLRQAMQLLQKESLAQATTRNSKHVAEVAPPWQTPSSTGDPHSPIDQDTPLLRLYKRCEQDLRQYAHHLADRDVRLEERQRQLGASAIMCYYLLSLSAALLKQRKQAEEREHDRVSLLRCLAFGVAKRDDQLAELKSKLWQAETTIEAQKGELARAESTMSAQQRAMLREHQSRVMSEALNQRRDAAARVIQRSWRQKRMRRMMMSSLRSEHQVWRLEGNLRMAARESASLMEQRRFLESLNATTGAYVVRQSGHHIVSLFRVLNEFFLKERSASYTQYKAQLALMPSAAPSKRQVAAKKSPAAARRLDQGRR